MVERGVNEHRERCAGPIRHRQVLASRAAAIEVEDPVDGGASELARFFGDARRVAGEFLVDPVDEGGAGERGAFLAVVGVALGLWAVRFDGFLDLHVVARAPGLRVALLDQILVWPVGAVVLWTTASVAWGRRSIVAMFGAVALSRVPPVVAAPCLVLLARSSAPLSGVRLAVTALIALIALSTQVAILYWGFRGTCGRGGTRTVVAFIVALIAAEILTKIVAIAVS